MPEEKQESGNPAGEGESQDKPGSDPQGDQQGGDNGAKKFTQAELDQIIKDRLEKEKRKAEAQATKAKEQAESEALAKSQEWESLAKKQGAKLEQLEAQVAELESVKAQLGEYEQALKKVLAGQRDGLPAHITALLDKLSPLEQLTYLAENAKNLRPANGVPETPDPASPEKLTEAQKGQAASVAANYYKNLFS